MLQLLYENPGQYAQQFQTLALVSRQAQNNMPSLWSIVLTQQINNALVYLRGLTNPIKYFRAYYVQKDT